MALSAGTRLGPYEILSPLGAGGMGEVYRAHDRRLGRSVAIKVLPAHFADRPGARLRFEREARAAASLNHPHICTVYDIGEQDGRPFIAMELLEGRTLQQRIDGKPLPHAEALDMALQIVSGLEAAHAKGIVHRDIKPARVSITLK
jgi:serine/threonine protein kinase